MMNVSYFLIKLFEEEKERKQECKLDFENLNLSSEFEEEGAKKGKKNKLGLSWRSIIIGQKFVYLLDSQKLKGATCITYTHYTHTHIHMHKCRCT